MLTTIRSAFSDIGAGFRLRRVWITLAREDIGDQHRRTTLGPLWLLVNYLAFAAIFIFLFPRETTTGSYTVYVSTGLVVWLFISEVLIVANTLFIREESFIKGTTLPLSVYIMRFTLQSLIRSGYALLGCVGIIVLSGHTVPDAWPWSIVGLLLVIAAAPATITVMAFFGAYFPDSQFIVSNLIRLGMFFTPVFWDYHGQGGIRHVFYHWNPFTYFLEVVRTPLMEGVAPFRSLAICGLIVALMWALAILMLGRLRRHLVFVL